MVTTVTPYNFSSITDGTSGNVFVDFVRETSAQTHYIPGTVILWTMFVIVLLSLKIRGFPFVTCLVSASFANLLIAILLFALGTLSSIMLIISIVMLPISVLALFWMGD